MQLRKHPQPTLALQYGTVRCTLTTTRPPLSCKHSKDLSNLPGPARGQLGVSTLTWAGGQGEVP